VSGQGAKAIIYDINGTQIVNPLTTGALGNYTFKAANGSYDVVIKEGGADEYIISSEQLVDLNGVSTPLVVNTKYNPITIQVAIDSTDWDVNGGEVFEVQGYGEIGVGSGKWKTIIAGATAGVDLPNGKDILQLVGVPNLAAKLFSFDINEEESIAADVITMNGFTDIEPDYLVNLKDLGNTASDSDGVTFKRKNLKAWKKPTGIKDSAAAGSFILNDGVNEPNTQVSGFGNVDLIGIQQSRDAVALFAQVDSAPALLVTSNTVYTATTITSSDFVAIWDELEVGLICDVDFGAAGWVGGVITSKTEPNILNINSWRNIDGISGAAATPASGLTLTIDRHNAIWGANFNAVAKSTGGANQAIGLEVGLHCEKAGTGTNSKGFLAVNLGGEAPEFGYTTSGTFRKSFTSKNATTHGYRSDNDQVSFVANQSDTNSYESDNPVGNHAEFRDTTSGSQVIITNNGKVKLGVNSESAQSRLSVRGDGSFAVDYSETELQIYDPTTTLTDRTGFYIAQEFTASTVDSEFIIGTGNTLNHDYHLKIQTQNIDRIRFNADGNVRAGIDNTQTFGQASNRWSEIFAGNGAINTSDEREKTFEEIEQIEKDVALTIKGNIKKFKWNDSINRDADGGNKARIHFGVGAQFVRDTLENAGLTPSDYSFLCYDEWDEEVFNSEVTKEAGNRYGIRYNELAMFILSAT
jgi:hypothetical protein